MSLNEQSLLLIRKADDDVHVMRKLASDRETADELWGFHAQQAVEKLLKALLVHWRIRFPLTHRLLDLADLLSDAGKAIPDEFDGLLDLTPYAVELRYSTLPPDEGDRLNRTDVLMSVTEFRTFVAETLGLR